MSLPIYFPMLLSFLFHVIWCNSFLSVHRPQHATRVFDMVDEFYIGDLKRWHWNHLSSCCNNSKEILFNYLQKLVAETKCEKYCKLSPFLSLCFQYLMEVVCIHHLAFFNIFIITVLASKVFQGLIHFNPNIQYVRILSSFASRLYGFAGCTTECLVWPI